MVACEAFATGLSAYERGTVSALLPHSRIAADQSFQ